MVKRTMNRSWWAHVIIHNYPPFWSVQSRSLLLELKRGFPGGSDSKESAYSAGDPGLISGSGRSPKEGNGYPLQYSCLENLGTRLGQELDKCKEPVPFSLGKSWMQTVVPRCPGTSWSSCETRWRPSNTRWGLLGCLCIWHGSWEGHPLWELHSHLSQPPIQDLERGIRVPLMEAMCDSIGI